MQNSVKNVPQIYWLHSVETELSRVIATSFSSPRVEGYSRLTSSIPCLCDIALSYRFPFQPHSLSASIIIALLRDPLLLTWTSLSLWSIQLPIENCHLNVLQVPQIHENRQYQKGLRRRLSNQLWGTNNLIENKHLRQRLLQYTIIRLKILMEAQCWGGSTIPYTTSVSLKPLSCTQGRKKGTCQII